MDKKGLDVGSHKPIGDCREIICHPNFAYSVYGCGVMGAPPGYHIEQDLTKPYPGCCGDMVKDHP